MPRFCAIRTPTFGRKLYVTPNTWQIKVARNKRRVQRGNGLGQPQVADYDESDWVNDGDYGSVSDPQFRITATWDSLRETGGQSKELSQYIFVIGNYLQWQRYCVL